MQGDPNCANAIHLLSLQMALNLSELGRVKLNAAYDTAGLLPAEDSDHELSVLGTISLGQLCSQKSGYVPCRCCLDKTLQRRACPSMAEMA